MYKIRSMRQSVFFRDLRRHGDLPRCVDCGEAIEVDDLYVSTNRGARSRRCIPCARRYNILVGKVCL